MLFRDSADVIGLAPDQRSAMFYALLMKDLGCSSNAARFAALFGSHDHDLKANLKHIDWSRALESFRYVVRHAAPERTTLRRIWRVLAVMSRGPEGEPTSTGTVDAFLGTTFSPGRSADHRKRGSYSLRLAVANNPEFPVNVHR